MVEWNLRPRICHIALTRCRLFNHICILYNVGPLQAQPRTKVAESNERSPQCLVWAMFFGISTAHKFENKQFHVVWKLKGNVQQKVGGEWQRKLMKINDFAVQEVAVCSGLFLVNWPRLLHTLPFGLLQCCPRICQFWMKQLSMRDSYFQAKICVLLWRSRPFPS